MRRVSAAWIAIISLSGCGSPKDDSRLHPKMQIRLAPAPGGKNAFSQAASSMRIASVAQLSDLNCFAINVRTVDQEVGSACGGITPGFIDGSYSGISTAFHPIVPTGTDLIFEAYGAQVSGDCPSFSDAVAGQVAGGVTFFRIGSAASKALSSITISVAFDPTLAFNCVPQ